jgi:para-nitrobenzyl esterase
MMKRHTRHETELVVHVRPQGTDPIGSDHDPQSGAFRTESPVKFALQVFNTLFDRPRFHRCFPSINLSRYYKPVGDEIQRDANGRSETMKHKRILPGAAVILVLLACPDQAQICAVESQGARAGRRQENIVKIDSGHIRGELLGTEPDIAVFRGVPFAAPPVKALRWRPPRPVAPWEGMLDCLAFRPWCPQPKQMLYRGKRGEMDEDCLYLNVWAPNPGPGHEWRAYPVMVWIHGGGFTTGSGAAKTYHGEGLAALGVVVVTINYRLGPFGFFAHPLLSKESEKGVSGNYGFLDQIAALEWIQSNIRAFGGDPECVTIFGESAGAASVSRLMVSPMSKGLFHRAIAQSGGAYGHNRHLREKWYGLEPMEKVGERIARRLGCHKAKDPVAALRASSADRILQVSNPSQGLFGRGNKFGPVVDGWILPDDPAALFAAGAQHDVPFMAGSTADEGSIFFQQLTINSVLGYSLMIRNLFGDHAPGVQRLFPAKTHEEVPAALKKLVTVSAFVAPARAMVRAMKAKESDAWLYHFTRVPKAGVFRNLGAFHGLDIPFVFGRVGGRPGFSAEDGELSDVMRRTWVQFARTGNPNAEGLAEWTAYVEKNGRCMEYGDQVRMTGEPYKKACDYFDVIARERLKKR